MKLDKVTLKLDQQTGQEMLQEELQNTNLTKSIPRIMELYHQYTYEQYPRPDCPQRMWQERQTMNCDDTNILDEAREKVFKQRLEELKKEQENITVEEILERYKKKG